MKEKKVKAVKLPCGTLCGYNCADKGGCAYWGSFQEGQQR